jgi:hypothetical protein
MRYQYIVESLKKTIEFKGTLNPVLWDRNNKLKADIWIAMNRISTAVIDYVGIPKADIADIILLGGNANYNWTDQSDIDIHIVMKPTSYQNNELASQFLLHAKSIWNEGHNIRIHGLKVEVYVELPEQKRYTGQGIYSLTQNRWVQMPTRIPPKVNDVNVMRKANRMAERIDTAITTKDIFNLKQLQKEIKDMRQSGLEQGGEFSVPNLVFKILRGNGKIEALYAASRKLFDADLTVGE